MCINRKCFYDSCCRSTNENGDFSFTLWFWYNKDVNNGSSHIQHLSVGCDMQYKRTAKPVMHNNNFFITVVQPTNHVTLGVVIPLLLSKGCYINAASQGLNGTKRNSIRLNEISFSTISIIIINQSHFWYQVFKNPCVQFLHFFQNWRYYDLIWFTWRLYSYYDLI